MKNTITKVVLLLSLVSFFTDLASEMLYPILPVYLESIGFSVLLIGVLEGIAEATSGLSKGYFGKLSDARGKRIPYVRLGYGLSAVSKPLLALSTFAPFVLAARTLDRLGKGIRTAPRDAVLASEASPETRGKVFGFHRGMDTLGAVFGPLMALVFLFYYPGQYRPLFFIAFIPGLIAFIFTTLVKDRPSPPQEGTQVKFFSFLGYWKQSTRNYRLLMIGLLAFSLINSSDFFLLLRVKGIASTNAVIWVYVLYNIVYAFSAYPLGALGDKIGLKRTFMLGILVFACVYGGMALTGSLQMSVILFAVYGIYTASTEGIGKAWISNICEKKDTGTAIGTYAALNSIATMVASMLAGLVWEVFGPKATFAASSLGAVLIFMYFVLVNIKDRVSIQPPATE